MRGGPDARQARHGQSELCQAGGSERRDSGVPAAADARRRLRGLQELGCGRCDRRRGSAVPNQNRRAVGAGRTAGAARQVAAAAARQMAWHRRHGVAISAPLRGSDRERGQPPRIPDTLGGRALPARVSRCARFSRSRDADAAPHTGRSGRAAVQDPPQCARPRHVSADRAGTVPEASDRRRIRARVRDQQELPQRRGLDAAQSRVHDARAVPGICRFTTISWR